MQENTPLLVSTDRSVSSYWCKETAQKEDKEEEDRNASPDLWGRHAGGGASAAVYCAA
jgi:hypothetical protein